MKNLTSDLTPIDPTAPVAPYLGGKRLLAKTLITVARGRGTKARELIISD